MPIFKGKPPTGNLPAPLSSFIGRKYEIREIRQLLSANRLVTLTGPGGCGKTRLALEVAYELMGKFEHGIWFVELAMVADPEFVPQTIAATLTVREQAKRPLTEVLAENLAVAPTLLILDNCEHLILACAQIAETLLKKCPGLTILVTSREIMGMTGEVTWLVPPLSLPDQLPWTTPRSAPDAMNIYRESESVQLFIARAESIAPDFRFSAENGSWVAEICRRLDGMPLAIELAAARVRTLSIQQIAQRLDDRFQLLTGGSRTAPPRHQTLAAALDWSYALLSEVEQNVLQRLSIFAGGATLEALDAVCTVQGMESGVVLEVLSHLVDKSLIVVRRNERSETRYHLLETIRQYALDKLIKAGREARSKEQHLEYFIQWAERAEPHLIGADQVEWLERYEAEHDNLRASLEWCHADENRAAMGLRLAAACGRFWRIHGYLSEGRRHLSEVLSRIGALTRSMARARALSFLANLEYLQSDYPAMRPVAEEALSIWRELGQEGKAGAAYTLDLLGELGTEEGDYVHSLALFQEAMDIYKELNDMRGVGQIHMQFGWAAMRAGDYPRAHYHLEEFYQLAQQVGDTTDLAYALSGLGEVAVRQGNYQRAASLLEQGLELNRLRGDKWGTATMLGSLGWIALRQHNFDQLRERLRASLTLRVEISDQGGIAWCLEKLAEAKYEQTEYQEATKIFGQAESIRAPLGSLIDPADLADYNHILSRLRSALGTDEFMVLWEEGAAMRLDEVVDYALSEPEPSQVSTPSEKEKFGGLTRREREVAVLIAQGKSNREIADDMTVGVKTIETYVTRILNKLGFDSRVQIATWVIERRLVESVHDRTT